MTDPRALAASFQTALRTLFMPEYQVLGYKVLDDKSLRVSFTAPVWRDEPQRAIITREKDFWLASVGERKMILFKDDGVEAQVP